LVPIYVEGNRLSGTSIDDFYRVVDECYLMQYSKSMRQDFDGLDNSNKVIIIDNFDQSRLNSKSRSILLRNINKHFQNVFITGDQLFPFDEVLSEERLKELAIDEYEQYQVCEFGHVLRSKLINKWNTIGKEELIRDEELIRKNDEAKQVFNTIIGKGYVAAFPIFLLIILQTVEVGRPHDLEESSFGYYYQHLIFESLSKVILKNDEIDAYYNFLTEFAYYMFAKRVYVLSREAFQDFHSQYCKEYAISSSFGELINANKLTSNLMSADIIEDKDGVYGFQYPYIFNFFVARYLANNLDKNKIRQMISDMCKRIYYEQFADIMMFLTHHSKDAFVLREILSNAKELFAQYEIIRFDSDMVAIDELIGEIPKLILEDKDIIKHREEQLQLQDLRDFSSNSGLDRIDKEIPDINEPVRQLNLIAELNVAFKTIEILGQILKNYSGSLKRPMKLELSEEAYMLGLRALNPFFTMLKERKQNLFKWVENMLGKDKVDKKRDIDKEYRLIIFAIFAGLSYGFVKTISGAVGSERLSPTFREILDKHDINSVNLVDISIKLDFYKRFPFDDLERVKRKVSNRIIPNVLLREMVREYLYMFTTTYQQKQKICQLVGISMIEQMVIDETSTQKRLMPPST
jgi:hypothetical protein